MRNSRDEMPWQRRRKAEEIAVVKSREAAARDAEASRLRKREALRDGREWASLAATVIAAVFAVIGFGIWILETPDRARDREIDRNAIVQHAKDVIEGYSAREVVEVSPDLLEAMATLAREREWIQLSAKKEIRFWDVKLPCGGYVLLAPSVEFLKADIGQSHILMDPVDLSISASQLYFTTLEIDDSLTSNQPARIDLFRSKMAYSDLNTSSSILAVDDLTLDSSSLKVGSSDFRTDVVLEFEKFRIPRTFIWPASLQEQGFAADPEQRDYLDAFFATAPEPAPDFGSGDFEIWESKPLGDRAPLAKAQTERCIVAGKGTYKCNDPSVTIEHLNIDDDQSAEECKKPYPLDRRRSR